MGRWVISSVPAGWFFEPGFGLRHNTPDQPASNITVKDDILLAGNKLEPYIRVQMEILKGRFAGCSFGGPGDSKLLSADESRMLLIRHQPANGLRVLQVQTYVRLGQWIGIVTLSTLEERLGTVRWDYEQFVSSLLIAPAQEPEAEGTGELR